MHEFHLHLVSDATGETVGSVARACLAQLSDSKPVEHLWAMVRSPEHIQDVIEGIKLNPGFVLYTLVNPDIRSKLVSVCQEIGVPSVSVLQPIMAAFGSYLKTGFQARPGLQHALDGDYYSRIDAMDYALAHDDGQAAHNLDEADVVIMGVSRTSKTPTCVYLANRGIKAANIPIILGCEVPVEVFRLKDPLVVGLVKNPRSLVQIRRNRLRMLSKNTDTDYANLETVAEEVSFANRLFAQQGWPVIDVTRKSIEETAAEIIRLRASHREHAAE